MNRKIAYCLPSLYIPGGMERVLTIKANYFAGVLGYEVYLILTDGKEKAPFYALSPKIHLVQLDVNFDELWNQPFHRKVLLYLQKQKEYKHKLRRCLMEIRPDITVSMLRREVNFIHSIKDGSKKIGEIHVNRSNFRDMDDGSKPGLLKRLFAKLWMQQLIYHLKRLDLFVILSREDQAQWPEVKHTIVIHNPLPFFPNKVSDCTAKQVIAVGRYAHQKGFDLLLHAWKIVYKQHPDWHLKIYGGGEREVYIGLRDQLGLQASVSLEEQTQQIADKYCESSLFVLSSRFEGFGMVLTEAMACGLPVVSFACPCGPRDIIQEGEDGLLVEKENVRQLAEKLSVLMGDDERRIRMGKNARKNVERFRMKNIGKQWEQVFNKLTAE